MSAGGDQEDNKSLGISRSLRRLKRRMFLAAVEETSDDPVDKLRDLFLSIAVEEAQKKNNPEDRIRDAIISMAEHDIFLSIESSHSSLQNSSSFLVTIGEEPDTISKKNSNANNILKHDSPKTKSNFFEESTCKDSKEMEILESSSHKIKSAMNTKDQRGIDLAKSEVSKPAKSVPRERKRVSHTAFAA